MREVNFDGLVGPSHNYAGLSHGNVASRAHGGQVSEPQRAALEGLKKMRHLLNKGLVQGVLPPQARPRLDLLRRLGFTGTDTDVLARADKDAPVALAAAWSASSMWAANAATVAPGADTEDGRTHMTPANLGATLHRSLEPEETGRALRAIFRGDRFVHHPALPVSAVLGDEGAANHTRLSAGEGPGIHLFVYGRTGLGADARAPTRFPARQTREASEAVARLHRLPRGRTRFVQQEPDMIDQGVFHNDVIAVGHEHVLLVHEAAYTDTDAVLEDLGRAMDGALVAVRVADKDLPVADAVASYLFNSQLVTQEDGRMCLIAPRECEENERARREVERIVNDDANPIAACDFLDVRQSMRNGGGPACLRLRVPLADADLEEVHAPCLLDEGRIDELEAWIRTHYRERLEPRDLTDPVLIRECHEALDALTSLLKLGSDFYDFQRTPARS